jgi:hypothetical protein
MSGLVVTGGSHGIGARNALDAGGVRRPCTAAFERRALSLPSPDGERRR